MSCLLTGEFKDIRNNTIKVDITSNKGSGTINIGKEYENEMTIQEFEALWMQNHNLNSLDPYLDYAHTQNVDLLTYEDDGIYYYNESGQKLLLISKSEIISRWTTKVSLDYSLALETAINELAGDHDFLIEYTPSENINFYDGENALRGIDYSIYSLSDYSWMELGSADGPQYHANALDLDNLGNDSIMGNLSDVDEILLITDEDIRWVHDRGDRFIVDETIPKSSFSVNSVYYTYDSPYEHNLADIGITREDFYGIYYPILTRNGFTIYYDGTLCKIQMNSNSNNYYIFELEDPDTENGRVVFKVTINSLVEKKEGSDYYHDPRKEIDYHDLFEDRILIRYYFSEDPVEITCETDNLFDTIFRKSCKINLLTNDYLGDILYSDSTEDITVKVYKNNNLIFDGYVEPRSYNQGYAYVFENIEINCIDNLSLLEYHYIYDKMDYDDLVNSPQILSFKYLIQNILGETKNIYFDNSVKLITDNSQEINAIEYSGISMKRILGDDIDSVMNNKEMLNEILQYLNLHIIQEGSDYYIFSWSNIIGQSNDLFINLKDDTTKLIDNSEITLLKEDYFSDDTDISIDDIYNQISLTCELDGFEDIVESPLESENLLNIDNRYHKFLREIITSGDGKNSHNTFFDLVRQCADGSYPENTWDGWTIREWYYRWIYNPNWTLKYHDLDILANLEYDSNNRPINTWKMLKYLRDHRFCPCILQLAKLDKDLNYKNNHYNGKLGSEAYYLVISVNGHHSDSEADLIQVDTDNLYASGTKGILTYNKHDEINYTPRNQDETNYLVFEGSFILNPVMDMSGITVYDYSQHTQGTSYDYNYYGSLVEVVDQDPDTTYNEILEWIDGTTQHEIDGDTQLWDVCNYHCGEVPVTDNKYDGLYLQQFFKSTSYNSDDVPDNDLKMIYPFVNEEKQKKFQYNYSAEGDSADRFNKIDILECRLKIGDKYLVEVKDGDDRDFPNYYWWTQSQCDALNNGKNTFSLGFDPDIEDYIISKEWKICNNMDNRYVKGEGLGIPITHDIDLSGELEFSILGVCNTQWNDIVRHPGSLFSHSSYSSSNRTLMEHISSIWIKDFKVTLISDNGQITKENKEKDIVYISDMEPSFVNKKDDITFKFNTLPTNEELAALGIDNPNTTSCVINLDNNKKDIEYSVRGEEDRAENLYIDEYYNLYHYPKKIQKSTIREDDNSIFNPYSSNIMDRGIITGYVKNLKMCSKTITLREVDMQQDNL